MEPTFSDEKFYTSCREIKTIRRPYKPKELFGRPNTQSSSWSSLLFHRAYVYIPLEYDSSPIQVYVPLGGHFVNRWQLESNASATRVGRHYETQDNSTESTADCVTKVSSWLNRNQRVWWKRLTELTIPRPFPSARLTGGLDTSLPSPPMRLDHRGDSGSPTSWAAATVCRVSCG